MNFSVIMWEQPSVTFYPGPVKNVTGEINFYFIKSLHYALVSIPYTAGIFTLLILWYTFLGYVLLPPANILFYWQQIQILIELWASVNKQSGDI